MDMTPEIVDRLRTATFAALDEHGHTYALATLKNWVEEMDPGASECGPGNAGKVVNIINQARQEWLAKNGDDSATTKLYPFSICVIDKPTGSDALASIFTTSKVQHTSGNIEAKNQDEAFGKVTRAAAKMYPNATERHIVIGDIEPIDPDKEIRKK